MKTRHASRSLAAALAMLGALGLSGCGFHSIQESHLPGTIGTGGNAIKLTVDLPDVSTLTPNGQVKVDDVNVGTVTKLQVVGWHARASVSLEPDVRLPANATASVGVDSLLGAGYLQLSAPADPQGQLHSGENIPLTSARAYPTTEQVLSAASFVLNGGGLNQIATITNELNQALGGDQHAVKDLLPRLDSFVTELNGQKTQIVGAIDDIDALAKQLNGRKQVINNALDSFPAALSTVSAEEAKLRQALSSLGDFGTKASQVIDASRTDLLANLNQLRPTLEALAASGKSLTHSLGYALTVPFPPATVPNACRGDYCNLFLTLDLTTDSLKTLIPTTLAGSGTAGGTDGNSGTSGTGTVGNLLGGLGGLLGGLGGTSTSSGSGQTTGLGSVTSGLCSLLGTSCRTSTTEVNP